MSKRLRGDSPQVDTILSWLQERKDEMAALLAELVTIPTENPPGKNYRACSDLLERRIRQSGLECKRLEPAELKNETADDPACLIANFGDRQRSLYFHGHYNVVPAHSAEQINTCRKQR